jgi:hypothetical protein
VIAPCLSVEQRTGKDRVNAETDDGNEDGHEEIVREREKELKGKEDQEPDRCHGRIEPVQRSLTICSTIRMPSENRNSAPPQQERFFCLSIIPDVADLPSSSAVFPSSLGPR